MNFNNLLTSDDNPVTMYAARGGDRISKIYLSPAVEKGNDYKILGLNELK